MNAIISQKIKAFEDQQSKYKDLGAEDTEPSYQFQSIIRDALENRPLEKLDACSWQLYDMPENECAAVDLNIYAKAVYDSVINLAQSKDIPHIQEYCWRVF